MCISPWSAPLIANSFTDESYSDMAEKMKALNVEFERAVADISRPVNCRPRVTRIYEEILVRVTRSAT